MSNLTLRENINKNELTRGTSLREGGLKLPNLSEKRRRVGVGLGGCRNRVTKYIHNVRVEPLNYFEGRERTEERGRNDKESIG